VYESLKGKSVLVTGASGFIGPRLVQALLQRDAEVSTLVRNSSQGVSPGADKIVGDLCDPDSLSGVCKHVDVIFHAAGYAHTWAESSQEDDRLQWSVNVNGTQALLEEAGRAGVSEFIFLSSVKVIGGDNEICINEQCNIPPETSYGRAKLESERGVLEAGHRLGMHVCNLRLALVYGPGVKGNLWRMIEAVRHGRFPPLPETGNKRSMVHVDDVVQAALLAATSTRANGQTYIVTDDQTYSTRYIQESIYRALGKRVPSWSVPIFVLRAIAKIGDLVSLITRRRFVFDSDALEKLLGSAWYSAEKIKHELGYRPKRAFDDAVEEMVSHYKGQRA